jgi:hypothetical protein
LIQIMADAAAAAHETMFPQMRSIAMTRAIAGKVEVVLEYPEQLFVGTFERSDQFDARFEQSEALLTLQRRTDTGTDICACRAVRLHLAPQVLADVLHGLAQAVSATAPDVADREALRIAVEALQDALATATERSETRQEEGGGLTADEESCCCMSWNDRCKARCLDVMGVHPARINRIASSRPKQ